MPRRADDGACLFLEDKLCGYRRRYEAHSLPRSCRTFPFLGIRGPEIALLGLSVACPTALGLLAGQAAIDVHEAHTEEPPVTIDAGALLRSDASVDAWRGQSERSAALHALLGTPTERLTRLAEALCGRTTPILEHGWRVSGDDADAWDGAFLGEFTAAGGDPAVLTAIWATPSRPPPSAEDLPDTAGVDEARLLNRYLDHRALVPTFFTSGIAPSAEGLLCALFAVLVRYREERHRGADPLRALWTTEREAVHGGLVRSLLKVRAGQSAPDWWSLGLLARAGGWEPSTTYPGPGRPCP